MNSVNTMLRGQSWLPLCCVLASLWDQVVSDVIVETVIGFKPVRIYEDAAARSDNIYLVSVANVDSDQSSL